MKRRISKMRLFSKMWFKVKRTPGFRLNLTDIIFITVLCGLAYFLFEVSPEVSLYGIPLYLGVSFFCFCNIFRIGNKLEPFWYIPFFLIAVYCLYSFDFKLFWNWVIFLLEPWKWILIIYHIYRRPYYGIGFEWVNRMKNTNG